MATPKEIRNIRLKNDYREMMNIKGSVVSWEALEGTPPYVEKYRLRVKIPTIIDSNFGTRNEHEIEVLLPPNYPQGPPTVTMLSSPQPYHPNWYPGGNWCYGSWVISEGLGHHVVRMIRTLQFDPEVTNPDDAANTDVVSWYKINNSNRRFPHNTETLPDPTKSKFNIQQSGKKTFRIN